MHKSPAVADDGVGLAAGDLQEMCASVWLTNRICCCCYCCRLGSCCGAYGYCAEH